jgi:hypothetical protein
MVSRAHAAGRPGVNKAGIDSNNVTRDNHYARWSRFRRAHARQNMTFATRQVTPLPLRLRQARTRAASCGIEKGLVT